MNSISFINSLFFSLIILSFSSCDIEGKEVCGIWNAQGDYGSMQIEIAPWSGKFHGYLLELKNEQGITKGEKSEEYVFITDLEFKDNQYQNGKIYLDPTSEDFCGLTLKFLNENQLQATYNCEGTEIEENWYRKGSKMPENSTSTKSSPSSVSNTGTVATRPNETAKSENSLTKEDKIAAVSNNQKIENSKANQSVNTSKSVQKETKTVEASKTPEIEGETKKQSSFSIIGIQEQVKYDDFKAMEKAIEKLWTKIYNEDFSQKLNNIVAPSSIYVGCTDYDQPKGKMTITIGYKTKDLSSIPTGLKGVKIPSNEYLVYPLSGEKSDFEGEGWDQLGELMQYRKASSADFEVYTFDENFKVKKAEMWVATK